MTREEKELQETRTELLEYLWDILKKFHDRVSVPELRAIRTLYNFELLIKDNLRLMDELESKEGDTK